MSATEASRSFAALLDQAERGDTVVITRGGKRIAAIGPAAKGNGTDFRAILLSIPPDDEFVADIEAARESISLEPPAWSAD